MKSILNGIFLLLFSVYVFVIPKCIDIDIIYIIIGVAAAINVIFGLFPKGEK